MMFPALTTFKVSLCRLAALTTVAVFGVGQAHATNHGLDRVLLRSGGELQGDVTTEKDSASGRSYVLIKLASGGVLKLDRSKLVRKIERASPARVEYSQRLQRLDAIQNTNPSTRATSHRDLMQWCLDQPGGKRAFQNEIEFHARQIIRDAPSDQPARRLLGYKQLKNQQWVLEQQFFAEHGYVKNGTSWSPRLAQKTESRLDSQAEELGDRKESLARWMRAARRRDANRGILEKELFSFCDAMAIGLIDQAARKERDPAIQSIYIEAIGRVSTPSAMRVLILFAIEDDDAVLRERSLTLLGQPHYDPLVASRIITEYFASKENHIIQRAAFAIGELGGTNVIQELTTQLVTTHKEKNPNALEAGRLNPQFRSDGGAGLQTGGGPQTIVRTRQNDQVLRALKNLTNQDFGYDAEQWQAWYINTHTRHNISVRTD